MSGPASFERPAGATVEGEFVGVVPASAAQVFALLARRLDPAGEAHYAADPASRRIVVQGDYWYRGEYAVEPDPDATDAAIVRHVIVNVVPGWHVLGALTGRKVVREAPKAFAALLAELGAQLA
ncbi:MAG: hypothetical protein ABIQ01_11935 [Pseudolysinimonas sp.]